MALGGAAVRFATLDLQSFAHDEAVTAARVLQPGFTDMLDAVRASERSGPLYYILAWLWSKIFGTGEAGLRSLSALFGTLAILAAYATASEFISRRAGVIAAALVAVNPYLFWFSQEARSYELFVLLSAGALWFLGRTLEQPVPRNLVLWAVAAAASLATHYFAVFLVVPQALLLLYRHGRNKAVWAGVAGPAVVGAALVPLILDQSADRQDEFTETAVSARLAETGVKFSTGEKATVLTELGSYGPEAFIAGALGAAGLILVGVVLLIKRGSQRERRGGALAAAIGLLGLGLPLALALVGVDLFNPRNVIGSLIPLLVVAAAGFGTRGRGRLGLVAAAGLSAIFLVGLGAMFLRAELQRPDWRATAEAIGPAHASRLVIAPQNADDPLLLYLEGASKHVGGQGNGSTSCGKQVLVDDVVAVTSSGRAAPPPPAAGFRHDRLSAGDLYDIHGFASRRPRWVRLCDLEGEWLPGGRNATLRQGLAADRSRP